MSTIVACPQCARRNRIGAVVSGVPRCSVCHANLPWVTEVAPADYDAEISASVPVLVDFWAPWCGPCRMVSPVVEQMAAEQAGHLKAVKLNVDEAPAIAARYGVQGIPLLVLLRDGTEVDRLVGAVPADRMRAWLAPHLAAR